MIRPTSKARISAFLQDFQVLKGECQHSMEAFGTPVFTAHEARLLVQNDRQKMPAGSAALYAIHHRSENKIIDIIDARKAVVTTIEKKNNPSRFPLPLAA